jgi:hypothetical protein
VRGNLLVAEHEGKCVTESDHGGEIAWQMKLDFHPIQAEPLRNGDVFIVGESVIVQVNRAGREVLKIERGGIRAARRLPNGQLVVITRNKCVRHDRRDKELKTTTLPDVTSSQLEILDNGNVLVPLGGKDRVAEYDRDGKEVWSLAVEEPSCAFRLPSGNTLVASQKGRGKFLEYDRSGKKVREHATDAQVFRIRGR